MTYPDDEPKTETPAAMPFLEHLEELRRRLLRSVMAVVCTTIVAMYFSDELMRLVLKPLNGVPLHNLQPAGTIWAYLKVALIAGVIAALPIVFYQMWAFIAPGLYKKEKRTVLVLIFASLCLFAIGAGFCYFIVLPFSLKFLLGFADDLIVNIITVGSYISFAGMLTLAFGFSFQLPIIAYFLARMGLVSAAFLNKGRRYAIVIILIVAGILTPTPDIFNQLLLAVPLYILYEVSIVIVWFVARRKQKEASSD
jgi:sec-independent protein translocase protein TatC